MTAHGRPSRRVRPFTPSQESAAELSDRTVGRDEVLTILIDRLASAANSRNRPHTLLVGPRGAGKTHLINVAIHRALQRPEVRQRLKFVRFDEDAVGITRYVDVLQEVLTTLAPQLGSRRSVLPPNPEEAIAEALGDHVLVLVIENLDRIFHMFGESGQRDLRSWVENSGQVMVLATTPLLFPGVSDRALPWWGNFGLSHLDELDVEQGRELLIRLARSSGDTALAEFLATDKGEARLRAINALAGGSPRIWMILSECLTVELLDELVPAVEALLEGLVPYYQQLLWDLSPVEQRLVRELADGPHQAATVAELAKAAGIEQRVAASTLGRLADIRWVRAEKVPELDKRSTWYRLREPMLRHHFQYRSATDQPLPLIVDILRSWYDTAERRTHLALASSASEVERLMASALSSEAISYDSAYADRDIDNLLASARTWIYGNRIRVNPPEAGALIDIAVTALRHGPSVATQAIPLREISDYYRSVAGMLVERSAAQDSSRPVEDRVGELLKLAADSTSGRVHAALELLSACWDGVNDPALAAGRLTSLAGSLSNDVEGLYLIAAMESVYWTAKSGDLIGAQKALGAFAPTLEAVLGPTDYSTILALRSNANQAAADGDPVAARDQWDVVVSRLRSISPESPETLTAEIDLAFWTGMAGDGQAARDHSAALVDKFRSGEDANLFLAKCNLALWTVKTGDSEQACTIAAELVDELASRPHRDENQFGLAVEMFSHLLLMIERNPAPRHALPSASGMAATLQAAVAGSAEAMVRLPSELVEIVESLRVSPDKVGSR